MERLKLKLAKWNISKFSPIQRQAIINSFYLGVALLAYIITHLTLDSINATMLEEVSALNKQNVQYRLSETHLAEEIAQIKRAEKLWEQVSSKEGEYVGLQLDKARKVLSELENKYNFYGPVEISLAPINEVNNLHRLVPNYQRNTAIVSTTMKLVIRSYSDTEVISFIYELLSKIPGYVQVTKWRMNRKTDISLETIKAINRGSDVWFFDSEIYLEWQGLKDLGSRVTSKERW